MQEFQPKLKWTSQTKYIDLDTGNTITKEQILNKEYRIINITKKIEKNETTGTAYYTNECKRNKSKQLQLY